ncbi:MAG: twin-arginine translocase subunit TatC [Muribaculaceae bacterium]|nr:twin-arginine translocase subunit TatC [Muribaculaceae bacterium]
MASDDALKEMSFWEHLEALRSVLIKIVVLLVVLAVALFAVMPSIFDNVILAPCNGDFALYRGLTFLTSSIPGCPVFSADGFHVDLINIQLSSQFFIHMSTSFWLALVLGFPMVIYLLWTFVEPALYPNEKRGARWAFFLGNFMFFLGLVVGYYIVFPVTLRFFAGYQVSELVPNQVSLDSYMDTFLTLIFMMGVVFEFPLVALMLGKMGVLHREFFGKYRRHAIVVLLILAAIITPSDPFSMMVVFVPVYLLYEVSAYLVKPAPKEAEEGEETGEAIL